MLLTGLISRGWTKVQIWREISRQRSHLRRNVQSIAKDIGVSRVDAEREADRPFWDYDSAKWVSHHAHRDLMDKVAAKDKDCCLQP